MAGGGVQSRLDVDPWTETYWRSRPTAALAAGDLLPVLVLALPAWAWMARPGEHGRPLLQAGQRKTAATGVSRRVVRGALEFVDIDRTS
jgi:hypothetical protein